jgi:ribonuclease P protein component
MSIKITKSSEQRIKPLKGKTRIEQLFTHGQKKKNGPIGLLYRCTENAVAYHVGVTVSKKKFARAVDRNKIKRQLREVIATHQTSIVSLVPPGDYMLLYLDQKMQVTKELNLYFEYLIQHFSR